MKALNPSKEKIFGEYQKISVGDIIFVEGAGPCSGGAGYGIGKDVIKITSKEIITSGGDFYSRINGHALTAPFAYYILFHQKKLENNIKRR